jgi:D-amino-acid dehydrogenase
MAETAFVVGAGIIGLACAHYLHRAGFRVSVIDPAPEGDKASIGNAGGIAVTEMAPASGPGVLWKAPGWLLDPLGPLSIRPAHALSLAPWLLRFARAGAPREVERIAAALGALNTNALPAFEAMMREAGISTQLRTTGALSVYESEKGWRADAQEWALKRRHGVIAEEIDPSEARAMEPALGPIVKRAMFTPQWAQVSDPRVIVDGLRQFLMEQDVTFLRDRVERMTAWPKSISLRLAFAGEISASRVIIAAGAWSGALARAFGDRVSLESERGYNTTLPHAAGAIRHEIIFAERKFVAAPLTCGLRIGGAAEFGGLRSAPNYARSDALLALARRYLPDLDTRDATRWCGHRPATPDSLPVISASPRCANVIYAFGHGHLGLTHSAITGRLVADMARAQPTSIDIAPYSVQRFH